MKKYLNQLKHKSIISEVFFEREWRENYKTLMAKDQSKEGRVQYLLIGPVLTIWTLIQNVLKESLSIIRVHLEGSDDMVGIHIPCNKVAEVLRNVVEYK